MYGTNFAQPQAVANTFDSDNRLTASGGTTYTYDNNGNLTSSTDSTGTTTNAWDTRNRLVSITAPNGQTTKFLYDFRSNRIQQNDSGPSLNLTQSFVLDDLTNVAYISRSNGDSVSVLAGRIIDQDLAVTHASGQVEYKLGDAVNTTQATVDQNGKLVSSFAYEPFGQTTTTSTYPFQFTGRVPVNSGLYYYRARYYCPTVGRFISEDPLGIAAGESLLYKYAGNSPVQRTDPTGLDSSGCTDDCQWYIGLVGIACATAAGGAALVYTGVGAGVALGAGAVCAVAALHITIYDCKKWCEPPPPPPPGSQCPIPKFNNHGPCPSCHSGGMGGSGFQ
jgi:RHS repeat-associated protein